MYKGECSSVCANAKSGCSSRRCRRPTAALAFAWWAVVLLHGMLPALFAIAMGVLVGAVQRGDSLTGPLALVGVIFVLLQVLTPIQTAVSHNLGDRTAAFLYDRLTEACVRPQGMAHLEDASARRPTSRSRATSISA